MYPFKTKNIKEQKYKGQRTMVFVKQREVHYDVN